MPASHAISPRKPRGGRPPGQRIPASGIRLRELILSGYTAEQILSWFDKLPPDKKIDILAKLEPKQLEGSGGGPIIVKWQD